MTVNPDVDGYIKTTPVKPGGRREGESPHRKFFAPLWKNVLDIV